MILKKLTLAIPFAFAISACQPTTDGGVSVNGWPSSDQSLSGTHLVEIEQNLRRLGLFRGRIDGQITQITRDAIARYQRSVGTRGNGAVSAKLVRSLRSSVAAIKPVRTTTRATTPRRQSTAPKASIPKTSTPATTPQPATEAPKFEGGQGDSGGDGGGGGDDGGSWG